MKEDMISEFQGEYRFLSNFTLAAVPMYGHMFKTVEHAYQAAKSKDPNTWMTIQGMSNPGDVKRFGRTIHVRDDWYEVRLEMMLTLQRRKYNLHPHLALLLRNTGNRHIQEGNRWKDVFWGVDLNTGKGENHMGKILMQVREELILLKEKK